MSEKIFRQIQPQNRPQKLPIDKSPNFRSAGGQPLPVRGLYEFTLSINSKLIRHPCYVIPDLNEPLILGIDFIQQHQLWYCPKNKSFAWEGQPNWGQGHLKVCNATVIPPLSVAYIKATVRTESGSLPAQNNLCIANITSSLHPLITGGPYLVEPDSLGQVTVAVKNCAPTELELNKNDFVGSIENVENCETREINPAYLQSIAEQKANARPRQTLTAKKKQFIESTIKLNVPEQFQTKYLNLLLKHHEAISQDKFDLGRTDTLMHEIALKSNEPIYVKQFKIPDAHRQEVEKHVLEWLKLGVIQPARSRYNSPIFAVMKKDGNVRLVQDFRALNNASYTDKYSMKDVSECIGEIGRSGSTIFTTIDLTAGFWQMILHPRARPYTAFTVPGMGQFQWVTSPMGLLGCPASFQRLMETVVHNIANVIVYIDDLLVHSASHDEHLATLDQVLRRLVSHNIKINLQKCVFGSKEVSYLGFRLTEEGIKPGIDKLKAVKNAPPPSSVHEVRQFLGLCNFFRGHVRNFAQLTSPLTALTKKDCSWKGGQLPPTALTAFLELQSYLCSEPIVDYPRNNRPYALIVDASLGDDKKPGGLGAILTQLDSAGQHCVIAYASRKLQKHECNYTPFLLEMQAAIWGMEHFTTYLRGRKFTLITDHRPLEKLGKVHTKTLNRLQEIMNTFDFDIVYRKGSEMPADYLSRNLVAAISWDPAELQNAQNADPLIKALKNFLLNKELPLDAKCQQLVKVFANDCFIEDDIVWRRIKRQFEPSRVVIFLPATLKQQALVDAHGNELVGHDGIYKTKERLFQCYYWPGMDADIATHLKACHRCQLRRTDDRPPPTLLSNLPQPTEPNHRVHADLFGPLKTSDSGKKFILCMTDALTKYVELVPLPNKEADTVANAIFDKWYCRFGAPLDIITDQGKEFCAKLSNELFKRLGTNHFTTSPHHPQCNSQAEVANKTIAKYLASFCDDSTLDWELYLAPLMFSYNTSFHRSVKNTPFYLTFGMEPRLPNLPTPDLRRKFYGESSTDDIIRKLLIARDIARQNNEDASDNARVQYDSKAMPHKFLPNQLVLLDEHSFLHKNQKLAPKWSGPHKIVRLKGDANAEILLRHNNRKTVVHTNRLKPYFVALSNSAFHPDVLPLSPQSANQTPQPASDQPPHDDVHTAQNDLLPTFLEVNHTVPSPSIAPPTPQISPRRRTRFSSSSSSATQPVPLDEAPPAMRTRSRTHSEVSAHSAPSKQRIFIPQVAFEPLPIFNRGEGLDTNDTINEGITINYVDADNSWTLVQKRKKKKTKQEVLDKKWNAQQKENFLRFGDIYRGESYKNYRNVDVGPPVAIQQPVAQPPVAVQGIPPPPAVPAPVQLPPVVAGAHPLPVFIITPPPQPAAQIDQEYPRLEAIPEEEEGEEEEDEPQAQGAGYRSPSSSSSSSSTASDDTVVADDFATAPNTPTPQQKDSNSPFGARGDDLLSQFRRLAFTPDAAASGRKYEVPVNERGEGAVKIPRPEKFVQHELADVGPPSQRTRQMQKDLEKTLLKRYEESKALEKKKRKEVKKEQP